MYNNIQSWNPLKEN